MTIAIQTAERSPTPISWMSIPAMYNLQSLRDGCPSDTIAIQTAEREQHQLAGCPSREDSS